MSNASAREVWGASPGRIGLCDVAIFERFEAGRGGGDVLKARGCGFESTDYSCEWVVLVVAGRVGSRRGGVVERVRHDGQAGEGGGLCGRNRMKTEAEHWRAGKGKGRGHAPFDQSGQVVHALAGASELFSGHDGQRERSRDCSGRYGMCWGRRLLHVTGDRLRCCELIRRAGQGSWPRLLAGTVGLSSAIEGNGR